jgi:hypothetical protein
VGVTRLLAGMIGAGLAWAVTQLAVDWQALRMRKRLRGNEAVRGGKWSSQQVMRMLERLRPVDEVSEAA